MFCLAFDSKSIHPVDGPTDLIRVETVPGAACLTRFPVMHRRDKYRGSLGCDRKRLPSSRASLPFADTPRVRPPKRIARPLSNAPVLNHWCRKSRRLSLSAMRTRQAVSSVVLADELPNHRAGRANWLHIVLVAAGITLGSSMAGVLVYDWYFDNVIVGLSSSLQPISDAFHNLGASHFRQASPSPGN